MEENKLMEKMALIVKAFDSVSSDGKKDIYTEEDKKKSSVCFKYVHGFCFADC